MFSQIESDLKTLDLNLNKMIGSKHPILYAAAEHLFSAGGKRIRPLIVLLAAKATNTGEKLKNEHKRLAEITEIIHTASLLHDDVIDESNTRRGSGTVNSKFNNKIAILAGDFLFAQSSWYLANLNNLEVVKMISKVITDFAEGEVQQGLTNFDISMSIEDYINKSFHKTASLLASSCKAAAIISKADVYTQNRLYSYGKHLGLAFQIVDDILDIKGTNREMGKPAGSDLKNGNLTAPLLFGLNEQTQLSKLIEREFEENNDQKEAVKLLQLTNGLQQAQDLAIEHAQASMQCIKNIGNNKSAKDLILLSKHIINRVK